jgi:flavodoxin
MQHNGRLPESRRNNMSKNSKDSHKSTDQSRRTFLKTAVAGLLVSAATQILPGLSSASAAEKTGQGKKVLVVYYSRSGNTREIANQIHAVVGGDIVELQTVNPYPAEYRATTEQARRELDSGYKPPLTTKISNIASYDIIFVGSPCWWGTFATPVWTFLSEYNLSGKTLAPFMTHEGSGLGRSESDLVKLCPNSRRLEGLAVRGSSVKSAQKDVESWLRRIGMKK